MWRMRIFLRSMAVLALGTAFLLPVRIGRAAPAGLGCADQGYTLPLPSGWTVSHACTTHATGISPRSERLRVDVFVEVHGWWSDARSRASIGTDLHKGRELIGAITWSTPTLGGRHFVMGIAPGITIKTGAVTVVFELETFLAGHMYKVAGIVAYDRSPQVDHQRGVRLGMVLIGISVLGVGTEGQLTRWAASALPLSYNQVNDHPDVYRGDRVVWQCVIARFLGSDVLRIGTTDVGCNDYRPGASAVDGEVILSVPAAIDMRFMDTGDVLTVYGTVDQPSWEEPCITCSRPGRVWTWRIWWIMDGR